MARVKKVIKAKNGVSMKKSSFEDVFSPEQVTEQIPTNEIQKKESIVPIAQPAKYNKINVAGYGDVDMNDELKRYISEKMSSYVGDQDIKNQFGYISDLYDKGGLQSINQAGIGSGANDPSLTNKRAARRQFWTGQSEDYARQQAASQYNRWIQDYAREKYVNTNKPKPKNNYEFDLKSDVYKKTGDVSGGYFNNLSHGDRRQFIESATEDWLKKIGESGDWNDETHSGNKDLYNRLRTGSDEFRNDLKMMFDKGLADKNLENPEMAHFVSKWGINPWELFGNQVKTEDQIKTDELAKAEKEKLDLQNKENLQKAINDIRSKYDYSGAGFKLNEPEDSAEWDTVKWEKYLKNPSNYTLEDYTGYYDVNPWDQDKYGMFKGRYVHGKKLADNEIHGIYDANVQSTIRPGLLAQYGKASPTRSTLFQKHPELKNFSSEGSNIYDVKSGTYPSYRGEIVSFVDSAGDRTSMAIKDPSSNSFAKINRIYKNPKKQGYYLAEVKDSSGNVKTIDLGYSTEKNYDPSKLQLYTPKNTVSYTGTGKPDINVISETVYNALSPEAKKMYQKRLFDGKYVKQFKNGGKLNLEKIKKLQFGGKVTDYMANEATTQKYNKSKDFEKKRSAYMSGEVFGDPNNNFELRTADKIKLGALLADVGGLVATAAPGLGNAVGAGIGAAGTLANLGADIADMENTGRSGWDVAKDAGLGLALDAATLIPGLGSGAKTSKVLKGIKSAWKLIQPALTVYGAANSLPAFQKIMSDEKLTIDDYRQIAQGLTAITSGAKMGAKRMATKKQVVASDINLKGGERLRFNQAEQGKDFITKQNNYKKAAANKSDIETKLRNANLTPEEKLSLENKLVSADEQLIRSKTELSDLTKQGNVVNKKGKVIENYDLESVGDNAIPSRAGVGLTLKAPFRKPNDDAKFWERIKRPLPFGYSEHKPGITTQRVWKSDDELEGLDRLAAKWVKSAALQKGAISNNKPQEPVQNENPQQQGQGDQQRNYPVLYRAQQQAVEQPAEVKLLPFTPKSKPSNVKTNNTNRILELPQKGPGLIPESRRLEYKPSTSGKVYRLGSNKEQSSGQVYYMQERIGQKELPAPERKALPPATKKVKSVKPKSKDLDSLTKDEFYKHGKRLRKQMQGAKKNKSSDSAKKEKQFKEALALFKSKFPGVPSFEKGGILKLQAGGTTHISKVVNKTMPDYLKEGVNKVVTPSNLKFLNTAATNRDLINKIRELPRPVNMIAPTTTKLNNVGLSSAMNQYNQLNAQENSMQPMYSDAKLNAAMRLSAGANANQMRNQIGQQIQAQNQQIDAQNAQLYSQDAANRAQVAAQNAAQQRQHDVMMNQYEQGLIRSKGQSRENLLSEWQYKRTQNEARNKQIEDQLNMMTAESEFSPQIKALNSKYPNRSTDPAQATAYQEELNNIKKNARISYLQSKKTPMMLMKNGGSLSDKKELAAYNAEIKRIAASDKSFNKMIADKLKSHEKILSLLMKNKIK